MMPVHICTPFYIMKPNQTPPLTKHMQIASSCNQANARKIIQLKKERLSLKISIKIAWLHQLKLQLIAKQKQRMI